MQLSETIKLYMTKEQKSLVVMTMNEYINTVNSLVSAASNGTSISKYTTADVKASLPSALTNQCIRDAKSMSTGTIRTAVNFLLRIRNLLIRNPTSR